MAIPRTLAFTASFANVALSEYVDFKLVKYEPGSKNVTVKEGESFTLMCQGSKYLRSCVWRHKVR